MEDRCTYIKNMTEDDREEFAKAVDYVCAICACKGNVCDRCELGHLISDVVFEFEVTRK